jgi:hypothetical protein
MAFIETERRAFAARKPRSSSRASSAPCTPNSEPRGRPRPPGMFAGWPSMARAQAPPSHPPGPRSQRSTRPYGSGLGLPDRQAHQGLLPRLGPAQGWCGRRAGRSGTPTSSEADRRLKHSPIGVQREGFAFTVPRPKASKPFGVRNHADSARQRLARAGRDAGCRCPERGEAVQEGKAGKGALDLGAQGTRAGEGSMPRRRVPPTASGAVRLPMRREAHSPDQLRRWRPSLPRSSGMAKHRR